MKVIQASGWYFPESCGGTEVYLDHLAQGLRMLRVESIVTAPREGTQEQNYDFHETPVYRYPFASPTSLSATRGDREPEHFETFKSWLAVSGASVYHQHALVPGCGLHHLRAARAAGLKTVFSFHVVGPVCLRGDLRRYNRVDCDGQIIEARCASCWAHHRGWPLPLPWVAAHLPKSLSEQFVYSNGSLASWAATQSLVQRHRDRLQEIAQIADRLLVSSRWMKELLLRNGLPEAKIRCVFLEAADSPRPTEKRKTFTGPLRIGFLGRWYPVKGIDLLVRAACALPKDLAFELTLYGVANAAIDRSYARKIIRLAEKDPRIRFAEPVAHEAIFNVLRNIDVLAVPSRGAETGPLVVLEALAAGTPVLCAPLGSAREWVTPEVNGWFAETDSLSEWTKALQQHALNPQLSRQLQDTFAGVPSSHTQAEEVKRIYEEIA